MLTGNEGHQAQDIFLVVSLIVLVVIAIGEAIKIFRKE